MPDKDEKKYSDLIKNLNQLQEVKAPSDFEADLMRKINSEKYIEKKQSIWSKFFLPSRLIPSAGLAAAAVIVFFVVTTLNPEELEDPLQMEPRVREDIIEVVDYDEVKLGREDKKDKNEAPLEKRTTVTETPVSEDKITGRRIDEEVIEESYFDDEMIADIDSVPTESTILGTTEPTSLSVEGETEMATGLAISKENLNFRQIQLNKEEQQVVDQLRQKVQIQATDSLKIE
ncbi:MAG: hypothetical protein HKM87_11835 [Ignavibacteriaceae bacterium]|nr:hypothetical protein [Ignavibacteriaceae bacterium]